MTPLNQYFKTLIIACKDSSLRVIFHFSLNFLNKIAHENDPDEEEETEVKVQKEKEKEQKEQ